MTGRIELRSDNTAGVDPAILAAVAAADDGTAPAYGEDRWTARLHERVAEVFEQADVAVFPVVSGTAANALGLSALCPPWGAVLCHDSAHILRSECGATSLLSGGAALRGLPGPGSKLEPDGLAAALSSTSWGDPHQSQPSVLSLTSPTDLGAVYRPDEIAALSAVARGHGLRVHLDGARLANALVTLGCSPAELTWRAGVDVVSLGATKNGALSTDAIVSFDPAASAELVYRTKRSGHVASKMRFQSAQLDAYLTDGRWLTLAGAANAAMVRLAAGLADLGLTFVVPPEANMVFVRLDDTAIDRVEASGIDFYRMGPGVIRLVTSFRTTAEEIDEALRRIAHAANPA